jgi:hypothetical protein
LGLSAGAARASDSHRRKRFHFKDIQQ